MRRRQSALAGLIVAVLATALASPSAGANPLSGNAMWIWYVSQSGGSAAEIARKAHNHDVRTVLVKSSDGSSAWSQFTPSLVSGLHSRGIKVCAWQFVYGNNPGDEARRGAGAVADGADCLVIDAEGSYEGKYAAADHYIRALRSRIGRGYPVALAGFPYVDYHPSYPYSVFMGRGGAQYNAPQMYWRAIGTSVGNVYAHTYRYNRPYHRPIFPLGQTYQDPPDKEIRHFRKYGLDYGASGVSWWSWQETDRSEWQTVGEKLSGGMRGFEPTFDYPYLSQGSAGDLVVLAQELLKSSGRHVGVSGYFNADTVTAVRRFQRDHGIAVTGAIGDKTWKALREYRPYRVHWSKRSAGKAASGPREPLSASLPALGYEIPPPAAR
jgi:hypothetical protein